MKEPEIVPDKLSDPINFKTIALIIGSMIGLHIWINSTNDPRIIVYSWSMGVPFAIIVFSFITAKKYFGTLIYSKAFKFLGISFVGIFFGELIYFIYEELLGLDPYPSLGDAFYFMFYPMIILFLRINIRFFSPKHSKIDTIIVLGIPITLSGIYVILTTPNEFSFDFGFGLASIIATTTTLGFAIQAVRTFRGGVIQTTWILFVIGALSIAIGDVWYYYLEIFEGYSLEHPVNLFWYVGYLFVLYSLLKHKKTL